MINTAIQTVCMLILLTVYFFIDIPVNIDVGFISLILFVDLLSIISFLVIRRERSINLKGQYIRISIVFLISFVIVHFQAYIDFIFGNLNSAHNFLWFDLSVVNKSITVSSLAFVSYIFGYSLNKKVLYKAKRSNVQKYETKNKILFFLGLPLALMFLFTVDPSDATSMDVSGIGGYSGLMLEALFIAYVILNCRNVLSKKKQLKNFKQYLALQKFPIILISLYIFAKILIGDRGPIIVSLLTLILGYIYVSKVKFSFFKIVAFIIVGAFLMNIVGLVRRLDKDESYIARVNQVLSNDNLPYYPQSFMPNTRELASSVRTLHISVSNVPDYVPHFKGLFFVEDLMLFIPSLRSTFVKVFSIPKQYTSSAQFITWISLGSDRTWGTGTSCVADSYLDFGVYGVIIIHFIFGFLTRNMELVIVSNSIASVAVLICVFLVFSYSLYIPRSTILYSLNKFAYVLLFTLLPLKMKINK